MIDDMDRKTGRGDHHRRLGRAGVDDAAIASHVLKAVCGEKRHRLIKIVGIHPDGGHIARDPADISNGDVVTGGVLHTEASGVIGIRIILFLVLLFKSERFKYFLDVLCVVGHDQGAKLVILMIFFFSV